MLRPEPEQRERLVEIRDNLIARIAEAEQEGWLGEVDGLHVSLAGAEDKLVQLGSEAARRSTVVSLGMPTFGQIAVRTEEAKTPPAAVDSAASHSSEKVHQRRSISPLMATRLSGFSCLPRGETLIHGSPCFLTIATPPVMPSARACSKRSSDVRSLSCWTVMNSPVSCGWPRAA
ncbi:hypothetical protein ACWD6R_37100 [Streptomyces sp. NPDC005151]